MLLKKWYVQFFTKKSDSDTTNITIVYRTEAGVTWATYLSFVWIRDLGVDSMVVLDILERLIHETSIASLVAVLARAVNEILFTEGH